MASPFYIHKLSSCHVILRTPLLDLQGTNRTETRPQDALTSEKSRLEGPHCFYPMSSPEVGVGRVVAAARGYKYSRNLRFSAADGLSWIIIIFPIKNGGCDGFFGDFVKTYQTQWLTIFSKSLIPKSPFTLWL